MKLVTKILPFDSVFRSPTEGAAALSDDTCFLTLSPGLHSSPVSFAVRISYTQQRAPLTIAEMDGMC